MGEHIKAFLEERAIHVIEFLQGLILPIIFSILTADSTKLIKLFLDSGLKFADTFDRYIPEPTNQSSSTFLT